MIPTRGPRKERQDHEEKRAQWRDREVALRQRAQEESDDAGCQGTHCDTHGAGQTRADSDGR